ncbi:hypothetical protein AL036_19165 [Salipiger aestuarii]|uniref:hypothetical protein n=1 Tax=Salipiger aestuarii TaxID=568098 RepID=UPI00123911A5|nr:hypothetical protein [Salipiger aestuarii]KAA8605405.1 hypothetical protein AL036_19165 [Salipiger aestuarii]
MATAERTIDQSTSPLIDDLIGHYDETLVRIPRTDFMNLIDSAFKPVSVGEFLASSPAPRGTGALHVAGGYPFVEVSSASADYDVMVGGLKLQLVPMGGEIHVEALGVAGELIQNTISAGYDGSVLPDYSAEVAVAANRARALRCPLVLPRGVIRVVDPEVLLPRDYAGNVNGFKIRGHSMMGSVVFYQPPLGRETEPMIWLDNNLVGLEGQDCRFMTQTAGAVFMRSYGAGVSQRHRFQRVDWSGTWAYGVTLEVDPDNPSAVPGGTGSGNNNSEYIFENCAAGVYNNHFIFLYGNSSDQNLNYHFRSCALWGWVTWAWMNYGGHVYVEQGDASGYAPNEECFLFVTRNTGHAQGICSLHIDGLRVEHKSNHALIADISWGDYGSVSLKRIDGSSQSFKSERVLNNSVIRIAAVNNPSPQTVIEGCDLMGYIDFRTASATYGGMPRAVVRDTTFRDFEFVEDAIRVTPASHSNFGANWSVEVLNCRTIIDEADRMYHPRHVPWDCNRGYLARAAGAPPKMRQHFCLNQFGSAPAAGDDFKVVLPINALLLKVHLECSNRGSSSSIVPEYEIRDADGIVLGTINSGGATLSAGFWTEITIQKRLSTNNKRILSVVPSAATTASAGVGLWLEYLA